MVIQRNRNVSLKLLIYFFMISIFTTSIIGWVIWNKLQLYTINDFYQRGTPSLTGSQVKQKIFFGKRNIPNNTDSSELPKSKQLLLPTLNSPTKNYPTMNSPTKNYPTMNSSAAASTANGGNTISPSKGILDYTFEKLNLTTVAIPLAYAAAAPESTSVSSTDSGDNKMISSGTSTLKMNHNMTERTTLPSNVVFTSKEIALSQMEDRILKGKNYVTAIVMHWKRKNNLLKIIQYLLEYTFIREIIVWNNNVNDTLHKSDMAVPQQKEIIIVNSQYNYGTRGRYLAAQVASNPIIYYQDDDFDARGYLNSLYRGFLSSPSKIHAITNTGTAVLNWKSSFYNPEINLHTNFAWIGCGAFLPRSLALQFLNVITEYNLGIPSEIHIDCMFAIATNHFPVIYSTKLVSLGGKKESLVGLVSKPGTYQIILKLIDYSIKTVIKGLLNGTKLSPNISNAQRTLNQLLFLSKDNTTVNQLVADGQVEDTLFTSSSSTTKTGPQPQKQQHHQSPCPQDKCVFITNFNGIDLQSRIYNYKTLTHEIQTPNEFRLKQFTDFPPLCAVFTQQCCWKSPTAAVQNYFGYDFLEIQRLSQIEIEHEMPEYWFHHVVVEVSLNDKVWKPLPPSMWKAIRIIKTSKNRFLVVFCFYNQGTTLDEQQQTCNPNSFIYTRSIRFHFIDKKAKYPIILCGFKSNLS